jgi:hypothetical protein
MPASELSVRPLTEADLDRFLEIDHIAFLEGPASPEQADWQRRFLELDRSIGVLDGQTQVVEHTTEAAYAVSKAFASGVQPWLPLEF